jgi:DNA-binding FadR family transcriptional regulator
MSAGAADGARAEIVAMRLLLQVGTSIPDEGALLGCEADICEEYGLGHRTFRQTLRILDDLGMLQVKRGRGGGYLLTRPAPIGVIRRIFALLASRGLQASDAEQVIWALNIANLRLVFRRLEGLDPDQRAKWCDDLAASLGGLKEMRRWMTFHKGLSAFADNLLLGTMNSSLHAYLGRVGPLPGFDEFDSRLVQIEQSIMLALRDGSAEEAEIHLRTAQKFISNKSQNS